MLQYVGTTGNTIEEQRLSFILSFLYLVGVRQTLKVAVHQADFFGVCFYALRAQVQWIKSI